MIDSALAGTFDSPFFTPEQIINAGISGFVLLGGIYTNPLMVKQYRIGARRQQDASGG